MIDINLHDNYDLYTDYLKCLGFLNSLDFDNMEYPEEVSNFHVYSEIKSPKELLCIESYLATQNLEKTKLILWSDYDISNNELIQPYKHLIDMRVYDAKEEAKGTALEDHPVWIRSDISDTKHYMKSGILRFLVTHKYGGVWADMDMVFLRDFKPILDQEWAYMWGSELDFKNFGPCAAIMNFKKQSQHSNLCMEKICETEIVKDSTVLDHVLLAKVYQARPFTVFPSTFFNTEWQLNTVYFNGSKYYNPEGFGTKTESGWFTKNEYSNYLFKGAFSWHWHNSTYKNYNIEDGCKFDILTKQTHAKLKDMGIM